MHSFGYTIVLLLLLLTGPLHAQDETYSNPAYIAQLESKAHEAKKQGGSAAKNNYDYIYARCNWHVNPAVQYISGNVLCLFMANTGNFNRIEFDLSSDLTVDSVIYFNNPINFQHQDNDLLVINLPSTVPAGTIDSVCIFYKGTPPPGSSRSFTTSEHAGVPILWTLSEPFGAKDWWPCKQNLSDKIDSLDIIVHVPDGNRVASNGVLLSEKVNGATKTVHWKTRYPTAAYLVAIAVTNYGSYTETVTTPNATVQVLNYVYPEEHSNSPFMGTIVGEMIKLFDSLTIPYPFAAEKYGHAQFNRGGGMEHQTMSFISGFDYSLMAHELAHQWFGDHITCGSWKDIWLNEGFATYFEGLCIERYRPVFWAGWREGKIKNVTEQPGGTIWCDDTTSVSRIFSDRLSYTKGAIFLHMLRWKLGDSLFFRSIKNYLNDPQLRLGFAKTNDLKKHLETTSGQNLDRFFDQWFYKEGYPSYKIKWIQSGNLVSITIEQTQSHPSVSFFEMPLQLKLVGPLKDSLITVNHTSSGQTFTMSTGFKVTDLSFDPEFWILSDKNTVVNLGTLDLKDIYVKIYPNPSREKITIEGFKPGVNPQMIKIIDTSGKHIFSVTDFSQFTGQVNINTAALQDGAYTVEVQTNVGSKRLKFMKK